MKRYFAFYNQDYYPAGGMNDFIGDFATLDEAISAITEKDLAFRHAVKKNWEKLGNKTYVIVPFEDHWGHIWDTETNTEVWDSNTGILK